MNDNAIHIYVRSLHRSLGGPSYSVLDLKKNYESTNRVQVFTRSRYKSGVHNKFIDGNIFHLIWLIVKKENVKRVVSNYYWDFDNIILCIVCAVFGIKLQIYPRGALTVNALAYKPNIKRILGPVFDWIYSLTNCELIYTSEYEKKISKSKLKSSISELSVTYKIGLEEAQKYIKTKFRKKVFIIVGRIHPYKNVDQIIRSFINVATDTAQLWVIGPVDDDDYLAYCKSFADQRIKFLGVRTPDELKELYNNAFALLNLSDSENYGRAIAEAINHCTPVVCTNESPWNGKYQGSILWTCAPKKIHEFEEILLSLMRLTEEEYYSLITNFVKDRSRK